MSVESPQIKAIVSLQPISRRELFRYALNTTKVVAGLVAGGSFIDMMIVSGQKDWLTKGDSKIATLNSQKVVVNRNIKERKQLLDVTRQEELIGSLTKEVGLLEKDTVDIDRDVTDEYVRLKPELDSYNQKMTGRFILAAGITAVLLATSKRFWKFLHGSMRD